MIKFHITFSILCMITFLGFAIAFKNQIKKNWNIEDKGMKKNLNLLFFFVPILNVLIVLCVFIMIGCTKEELEEFMKNEKD